jgi:nitroimidazol reductase NimA-like FMN-containing flavoprotein (pyridoxamine 5'-phosphate oxidase superfamily)
MDALTPQEIEALLDEGRVAHLAVVDGGVPYVTPLSYVYSGGAVAFRTVEGRRVSALRENPRVCIEVTEYDRDTGSWSSVVAFGDAEIVDDDIVAGAFIAQLLRKYSQTFERLFGVPDRPNPQAAYVVRVPLEDVDGRCSGRFLGTTTRPGRL